MCSEVSHETPNWRLPPHPVLERTFEPDDRASKYLDNGVLRCRSLVEVSWVTPYHAQGISQAVLQGRCSTGQSTFAKVSEHAKTAQG